MPLKSAPAFTLLRIPVTEIPAMIALLEQYDYPPSEAADTLLELLRAYQGQRATDKDGSHL